MQAGAGLGFENTPQREARLSVAPQEQERRGLMREDVFKTKPGPGRRDHERYRFLTPIARMRSGWR